MTNFGFALTRRIALTGAVVAGVALAVSTGAAEARITNPPRSAVTVLSGGCYWGMESVFRHVKGVQSVVSGYATPTGTTSHAEAVRITYDPSQLSYRQILDVFFSVAHDPTQLNRQGPDEGTEYRSIVFVDGAPQRQLVHSYIDSLSAAHVYRKPIVTEVDALQTFEPVAESQQNFAEKHPDLPYIRINDAPKIQALERRYARLYRD